MNYETIVIGAGIAGLTAAIGRAERGERVLLLAMGHGATHWSAGCVDLLDAGDDPTAALAQLVAEQTQHPYALAGLPALEGGLARLRAACAAAAYPLVGSPAHTLYLPTAVGALRPTCLAPITMIAGEARQLTDGRPTLIVGFHALRDFFPPLIAANLRSQGCNAEGLYLDLPSAAQRRDLTPVALARLFERPAVREQVGAALAEHVRRSGFVRIGMPAVLGLRHAVAVVNDLQARSGALIFEIPTLPTSVPGLRLFSVLETAAQQAGVRVQIGAPVQRAEADGDILLAVYSEAAAREQRHTARRWVLATGGVLGGGLRTAPDGLVRETALDLPVQAPAGRAVWFDQRFLAEAGQPVFKSGLAVDAQLRPLDAAHRVVYQNLVAAGGIIAGYDPIREGCLEGVALATGYAAGQS